MMSSGRVRFAALALACVLCLAGCSKDKPKEQAIEQPDEVQVTSITRETEEEVASRSRDVSVISGRDATSVSFEAAQTLLESRGFKDVSLLVEGSTSADDGTKAAKGDSSLEMVGWWLDAHDRVWALHVVSGEVFASRVWMDASATTDMIVAESERVTMYNADLGRLVRVGVDELGREGIQVVSVESLTAETLGGVEVVEGQ